jgi:hypothetical protein
MEKINWAHCVKYEEVLHRDKEARNSVHTINVCYIPTYAQISSVNLCSITPTCLGVNTPSSGSLQVVSAKVMN